MIDNTTNQPGKIRTKNWTEVNNESRGAYKANSQIEFKTLMLRSILSGYSDTYILVSVTVTVPNIAAANLNNKKL